MILRFFIKFFIFSLLISGYKNLPDWWHFIPLIIISFWFSMLLLQKNNMDNT